MSDTKQERDERHKAILAALDTPGERSRSDADIAAQIGCGARSVAYVRGNHPTLEEMDRKMKALDSIFLGIYKWYKENTAAQGEKEKMMCRMARG